MEAQAIYSQIQPTFIALAEIMDALKDYFNRPPSYGGWTPGQVARHLQLSNGRLVQALQAPNAEERKPENEKIPSIIGIFLNFEATYNAPEIAQPEDKEFDESRMREWFYQLKTDLLQLVPDFKPEIVVPGFEFPGLGSFTRLEMLAFALFHTQRHIRQMEKMLPDFKASTF